MNSAENVEVQKVTKQLTTPVLFLVFNRPAQTQRVLDLIKSQQPCRLYIAADGPRETKVEDVERCAKTRQIILQTVDWPCEVRTLFRQKNLGCKHAVSQGITWFFEQEEEGIILEDDCLPDPSFFSVCAQLLEKYRNETKIFHISGYSAVYDKPEQFRTENASYYFSKYVHTWGWATWRRAWQHYEVDLAQTSFQDILPTLEAEEMDYWEEIISKLKKGKIDTWDYQWLICVLKAKGLCISPYFNLITNIGFGDGATHTGSSESRFAHLPVLPITTLHHPSKLARHHAADHYFFESQMGGKGFKKLTKVQWWLYHTKVYFKDRFPFLIGYLTRR